MLSSAPFIHALRVQAMTTEQIQDTRERLNITALQDDDVVVPIGPIETFEDMVSCRPHMHTSACLGQHAVAAQGLLVVLFSLCRIVQFQGASVTQVTSFSCKVSTARWLLK